MDNRQREAYQAMSDWLSHPERLGKQPAKMECAGKFEHEEKRYYLFKFKKSVIGGKWLLGVAGGFPEEGEADSLCAASDMAVFDIVTAVRSGTKMIERLFREEDPGEQSAAESEEEKREGGPFVSFVLLESNEWSKRGFVTNLRREWGIDAPSGEESEADSATAQTLVWDVDGMLATVSLMPGPVPDGEAEQNAANNYLWPEAVAVTRSHVAHILVAVIPRSRELTEAGKLLVKLTDVCLLSPNALGVYTSGTVFEPSFYRESATVINSGELPFLNWLYFGLPSVKQGVISGYTYGLSMFGKDEIEVLDSTASPQDMRSFLLDLAAYVITADAVLRDGDTIGFSDEQKLLIVRSPGVYLEGNTLKIDYVSRPEESTIASVD